MVAKQTYRYRGHVVRIWEKSYRIGNEPIRFRPNATQHRLRHEVKQSIDSRFLLPPWADRFEPYGWRDRLRNRLDNATEVRFTGVDMLACSACACAVEWIALRFIF